MESKSTGSCNGGRDCSDDQAYLGTSASICAQMSFPLLIDSMPAAADPLPSNPELSVDISHSLLPNSVVMSQPYFETILAQVYGAAHQSFDYEGEPLDCPDKLKGLSISMQEWHNNGTDAVKLLDKNELDIRKLLLHSNFGIVNMFCWLAGPTNCTAQSVVSVGKWTSVFHRVGFSKDIFSTKYKHEDYLRNIVHHEMMHRYHEKHPVHPASDSVLNYKYCDSNRLPKEMTPDDQTIIKQVKEAGLIIPKPGLLAVKVYLDLDSKAHLKLAVSFREAMERVRLLLFKSGFKDGIYIVAEPSNAQLSISVYPDDTSKFSKLKLVVKEGVQKAHIHLPSDGENEDSVWHMAYTVPLIVKAVSTPILRQARLNLAAREDVALLFKQTTVPDSCLLRKETKELGDSYSSMLGLDYYSGDIDWANVFLRQSEGPSETDLSFFCSALEIKSPIESRNPWFYLLVFVWYLYGVASEYPLHESWESVVKTASEL